MQTISWLKTVDEWKGGEIGEVSVGNGPRCQYGVNKLPPRRFYQWSSRYSTSMLAIPHRVCFSLPNHPYMSLIVEGLRRLLSGSKYSSLNFDHPHGRAQSWVPFIQKNREKISIIGSQGGWRLEVLRSPYASPLSMWVTASYAVEMVPSPATGIRSLLSHHTSMFRDSQPL